MKASELRIGNYVKQKTHPTNYIINAITSGGGWIELTDKFEYIDSDIDSIEPISLTEDILLKCNIKQYAMNGFKCLNSGIDIQCSYDCKHLHQLQNLYFTLTGEELNINF